LGNEVEAPGQATPPAGVQKGKKTLPELILKNYGGVIKGMEWERNGSALTNRGLLGGAVGSL